MSYIKSHFLSKKYCHISIETISTTKKADRYLTSMKQKKKSISAEKIFMSNNVSKPNFIFIESLLQYYYLFLKYVISFDKQCLFLKKYR